MWDAHLPRHGPDNTCKVAIYTRKYIASRIKLHADHPIANLNTMVINVSDETVTLRLINVYHEVPNRGHGLRNLLQHDLDEMTPTILLGDFNTHSYRWSLTPFTPSPWHHQLHDWLDLQGLTCLNPSNMPTWFDLSNRA
jgi:endonuclease/exonuclease/phosphatase (EEP) superfamily protein YafD